MDQNTIWPKEEKMILNVAQRYGITVLDIVKVRSAYKLKCKEGTYCLKRMKHGRYKVKNGYILVEHLKSKGFKNTANYIKTKDNEFSVKYNKYILYLTEWIDGEECKIDSEMEASNCSKLLAEFHLAVSDIDTSNLRIKNNLKNLPKIFLSNLQEMEQFKKIISKKRIINEFDSIYNDYIDKLYNRGLVALNILNKSNYHKLSRDFNNRKTICHDSFYYQNILKKEDKYYIIDLDSIIIDLQVNDLGKFIRRLMYKKEYKWDFDKVRCIIEEYNTVKPLTSDELEVMLALIVFPHKFWKLGKKRYVKHKHWSESKYMKKLNKIIKYSELQDIFIEKYMKYVEEYKNNNEIISNID